MSLRVQTAVWEHSVSQGNDLTALLAIADNADDDGYAFPGYPYLAAKCRMSPRGIKYVVKRLLKTDELTLVRQGARGRSNQYKVEVQALHSKPRVVGVQVDADRVQIAANGVQPVAPEPKEPSEPKEIFEFWIEVMSKNGGTRFTPERRRKVVARLKSYDADYIKRAIVNCSRSEWHMKKGRYADRGGKIENDLELICRNDTKLESFWEMGDLGNGGDAWVEKGFLK